MAFKTKFVLWGAFALALVATGTYYYHQKSQQENGIGVKFNPIEQTDYESSPKEVYPLNIQFSGRAAPIEQLNAEDDKAKSAITEGVKIEPAIDGKWAWQNDSLLTFTPADDWGSGQTYQVTLTKQALNPNVIYRPSVTEPHSVTTPPFKLLSSDAEFYQAPNSAHIRYSIAHFTFSHPINPKELEKLVEVNLVRQNADQSVDMIKPLKFSIRYAENKLEAWVNSEELALSTQAHQFVQTKIAQGLRAQTGGNALDSAVSLLTEVPTKYSLKNTDNRIEIVNNQRDEAEQVLQLHFNYPVKGKEIEKNLSVLLLPEPPNGNWTYSKLTQSVLDESETVQLALIPTEQPYAQMQAFRLDIPEGRCVYVDLGNQFSALGGYQLKEGLGDLQCAPSYPTYVGFVGEGSLLSQYGDGKLTLAVRNAPRVKVDIGRVQGEQLRHIANLNSASFQNPSLGNLKFDDIANFKTKIVRIENQDPRKSDYVSLDLAQKDLPKRGIFWVKASAVDSDDESQASSSKDEESYYYTDDQTSDTRLIVLTDLGIIAKKAADGSQSVFVQSIATGAPVENAVVKVISRNNSVLASVYTNSEGKAVLQSFDNYKQEMAPVMYLVSYEGDQSFLPIGKYDRTLDFSRFDIRGEEISQEQNAIKTFLFNDRGIYRPGESVNIGLISKALDWQQSLANVPLTLELRSPSGKVQWEKSVRVDKSGLNSLIYPLAETAETGEWSARVYIGKQSDQTDVGSMSFQVQEFQPDSLKINTVFNHNPALAWVSPQDLNATVHLTNLFGTNAQQRKVTAQLLLHSAFPRFPEYQDYQFYDNQRSQSAILLERELQDQITDKDGKANFELNLTEYAENTVQMLYFTADGYENNSGRGVSNVASVLVSAQPWLVGYQGTQDLDYLREKSAATVKLIAVDPSLKAIAVENLSAVLMERKYVSVLTEQRSGAYQYESKLIENQINEQPLNIAQAGSEIVLNTERSGDFVLVINNQYGETVNRIPYTVIGNRNLSVAMDNNTELKLNLNKKQFMPGEEIEVAINAPYAGSGLITIERDRVYAHQWFNATTNRSVQKIRIPENFEGSGYINVQFSRDIQSSDIFTSPLSYGVVPFSVNVDNHRLKLDLSAPKLVKSGEEIAISLKSDKPTKAIVYAVNEGILQVAGYQQNDPLNYFFPRYALQVETLQILDLILPEFSKVLQYAQTGGDSDAEDTLAKVLAANTNPFKRKTDKPAVFWSGIIDVNGEQHLTYQPPQGFNGNLKVMAVAVTQDGLQMNIAQTDTVVRDDMILSPTAPLTLAPNDETQVSLTLANNTKTAQNLNVVLQTDPQFQLLTESQQSVSLAPMSEAVVNFTLKATDKLGDGALYFSTTYMNDEKQSVPLKRETHISVRPLVAAQQWIQIGEVGANSQVKTQLPALLFPQYRQQSALISPAPLALAQGISTYLVNYDNLCTEQIISAAMPNVVFAENPTYQQLMGALSRNGDNQTLSSTQIQQNLTRVFNLLPSRQTENNGFGLWSNVKDDSFVTIYVAHFLIEAMDRGIQLPDAWLRPNGLVNTTMVALTELSRAKEGDELPMLRQRAYATYLLARLGRVPSDSLMSIHSILVNDFKSEEWQKDITAAWLAATYQLVKQSQDAEGLIRPIMEKFTGKQAAKAWYYDDKFYFDPLIEKSTLLYILARHFPQQAHELSDTLLNGIVQDLNDNRYNSLSSSMVLLALDAYGKQHPAQVANLHIQQNGEEVGQPQGDFVMANLGEDKVQLNFVNQTAQKVWYAISQSGYVQKSTPDAIKNGVEIDRTYTDKHGNPISRVKLGDEIYVRVKARSLNGIQPNMVITDLYPAGFEVLLEGGPFSLAHRDLREDRMLSYGVLGEDLPFILYRLKATNIGKYQIPRAYAENMYNRAVNAQSADKGWIEVVP